jgi:hypothetical protein
VVHAVEISSSISTTAQTVLDILNACCDKHAPAKHGGEIEDHFFIDRIEPGKLWLNPLTGSSVIGPIPVPNQVTALCEPGWDIGGVVVKVGKGWRMVEVWLCRHEGSRRAVQPRPRQGTRSQEHHRQRGVTGADRHRVVQPGQER